MHMLTCLISCKDDQIDGVIGDLMDQEWNTKEEDFVRVYAENGEVSYFIEYATFTHLTHACTQDFGGSLYAFIYATWDDLKKCCWDRIIILATTG